ncbi:MAG: DUF1566 domain-containing protein, partial [Bacteroidota bacterium]
QAPNKMSYQAVIRNSSNALVTNSAIGMRISILQTSPNGMTVYVETQTPTTNTNGLASIEIGGGAVVSGSFSNINWSNGPYFVETETDPAGGTNYSITGTSQLLSVPYALYAANSGSSTPGPQGPTGPQGPQGATGPQGPAGVGGFIHYIGEEFGGGVIFHLWKDNLGVEHGLVLAITDQSTSQPWSNITNITIGINAQSTWDGLLNSNSIVGQPGHSNSAAQLCLNLVSGGQNDWYLPSIDELGLLWHNRFNINKVLSSISGASILPFTGSYWSSTEGGAGALGFAFNTGAVASLSKGGGNTVRAIRSF